MKLGRRKFLGFMSGAVAAGPKLAQNIAEVGPPSSAPMGGSISSGSGAALDSGYLHGRIAELRKILAGEDPEEKRRKQMTRLYQAEQFERFRLDGLRSVSPVHKLKMLTSGAEARQERIQRLHAEFELSDLLKQLG